MTDRDSTRAPERKHAASGLLPCRGCTPDCSHRPHCQGRPWRAALSNPAAAETRREQA